MHVSQIGIGKRSEGGIGYIILPEDSERSKYIQFCYSTGTVTIVLEDGGIIDKVLVSKHIWDYIEFPKNPGELGSLISWQKIPNQNYPIVIGIFNKNNETIPHVENQASLIKSNKEGVADITVDGEKSNIYVSASSLTQEGGDIYIKSKNGNRDSKINISANGDINISSKNQNISVSDEFILRIKDPEINEKKTILRYKRGEGLTYEDEFKNIIEVIDGKVNIDSENINLGSSEAKEFIVLGNSMIDFLSSILDLLGQSTTTTIFGASPLLTGPQFLAKKAELQTLLSKKHKIE